MLKKILLILAGLAIVGGIAAALVVFQPWNLIGGASGRGNTPGNIVNLGMAAQGGKWHFYRQHGLDRRVFRMTADGKDRKAFIEKKASNYFNTGGSWLYYTKVQGIFKIKLDGTKETQIYEGRAISLNLVDGWLYFQDMKDGWSLYRIRPDGTELEKILTINDKTYFFNVVDGWIYYNCTDEEKGTGIHKVRTDGTDYTLVTEDQCGILVVDGEWIYYDKKDDNESLYRVKIDGTEKTKLCESRMGFFNISDGWIYYSNMDKNLNLYKMRTDGTEQQLLLERTCYNIIILNEWIYYEEYEGDLLTGGPVCRVRTDGTGWENLNTEP